jgi:predicted Zn-dependent protease
VAKGIVYDSYTANKEGKQSTGHALPAPNTYGPVPINVFMAEGKQSAEEMIASTERGLLVTRFHYVNIVHPKQTILTGMTRDGTFLIEGGKVTGGVKNLRFTQNVVMALSSVLAVGDRAALTEEGAVVPCLKLASFAFTSAA